MDRGTVFTLVQLMSLSDTILMNTELL